MAGLNSALKEALSAPGVDAVLLRAVEYADWEMRRYSWRGQHSPVGLKSALVANGWTADEFVAEALKRLWDGPRTYREDRDLLSNLKSVVQSLISSHKKASDRKPLLDHAETLDSDGEELDPIQTAPDQSATHGDVVVSKEILTAQEACHRNLRSSLDGDADLLNVLDAIDNDITKSAEIAELYNWPVEKVYELKRKLKNHAIAIFGVQSYKELEHKTVKGH